MTYWDQMMICDCLVSKLPQYCAKIVLKLSQICLKIFFMLFQSCPNVVWKLSQNASQSCLHGVSKSSEGCTKVVSKYVSRLSNNCQCWLKSVWKLYHSVIRSGKGGIGAGKGGKMDCEGGGVGGWQGKGWVWGMVRGQGRLGGEC